MTSDRLSLEPVRGTMRPGTGRPLVAALTVLAFLIFAPAAAHAAASMTAVPSFPATVTVGDSNLPASVTLSNQNTELDGALTLCNAGEGGACTGSEGITLLPSCGSQNFNAACVGLDPGVFNVDSPAMGATGTSCASMPFSATLTDPPTGKVTFRPAISNVVLPSTGATCRIDFTVDVLSFPDADARPVAAGLQTVQIPEVLGVSDQGTVTFSRGSSNGVTVRGRPTAASTASAGVVIGGSVTDTVTLTGEYNPAGGNVTFNLYGPGDAGCSLTPAFSSTVAINADGTATSPPFVPTTAGTYRWVASYGGDAYNDAASAGCNSSGSTVTIAKASPTIQGNASPPAAIGGAISHMATLAGEHNPTNGNVTFRAYGPADATCSGTPAVSSTVAINSDGTASSPPFVPTTAGTYRWIASYGGDVNNGSAEGSCADAGAGVTVSKATPAIQTAASPSIVIGATVSAGATLTGEHNPAGGQMTFQLYGPADASCTGTPAYVNSVAVQSDGTVTSAPFTPTAPGTYRWVASYGGDANNAIASGACNDASSTVTVAKATPALQAEPSPAIVIGATVSNTVTLTGEHNPTGGSVTFALYGPSDANCTATAAYTVDVAMAANGTVTSPAFTPGAPGTYRWVVTYGGDANNVAAGAACNTPNSTVTVSKATPSIHANASASVTLGATVTATATLTGEHSPTGGSVTFRLYAPGNATCTGASVFESTVAITAAGTATSAAFAPAAPGTYRWVATYGGDATNDGAGSACADPNAHVAVSKRSPVLQGNASPSITIGAPITSSATLTSVSQPASGSVTFRAFGPGDASCAGAPAFTSTVAINADGTAASGAFVPTAAGTYRWIASYGGDAGNDPAAGACNDPNTTVTVSKASPSIATNASPSVVIGGAVSDTAALSGASTPVGGSVTFRLYGPGDATCSTPPAFTSTVGVRADGTASSASFTPAISGTYRWTAEYSGDANNNAVSGACNDPNETVVAGKASPSITTKPSGSVTLGDAITDTAALKGQSGPVGGTMRFTLFGPDDATCSKAAVFTATVAVSPDGRATSPPFVPTEPGTYRWVATYSGDPNNGAATGGCDAANAVVVEEKASPLLCGRTQIALVDVFPEGRRMIVSGVARPSLRGQRTNIVLEATGAVAVTAKIGKGGTFAATAPLPASRLRSRARYAAVVKPHKSVALKLNRRSYMTKAVLRGEQLMLSGKVTGRYRPGAKVAIKQITLCTKVKEIATTKLKANGTWRITIPAPENAASVLFRAKTTVLNGAKVEQTFTLPRPATLSSAP